MRMDEAFSNKTTEGPEDEIEARVWYETGKHYYSLFAYNQKTYGRRVMKAALDAGLSCPNRNLGGCSFCRDGSRYFAPGGSISEQMEQEITRIRQKYPDCGIIAYFQSGTNTNAPAGVLQGLWEEAMASPDVVGLSVATRADCLPERILKLLSDWNRRTALTVELGLQSVSDVTADRIHRGHTWKTFRRGYTALKERGIRICVHLINGLPGDTKEQMIRSARELGALRPDAVKIHLLHVETGTELADAYLDGSYVPMEMEEYIAVTAEQMRYFPPDSVVERLTGDGDRRFLLAPLWSRDKRAVLGGIDHMMRDRNIWQGDLFSLQYKAP